MSEHGREGDAVETAALYLSGALPAEAREAFEARLAAGDSDCIEAMKSLSGVCEELFRSIPPAAPPEGVREALLARIGDEADSEAAVADQAGVVVQLAAEADWLESGNPGIRIRQLFTDMEHNRMTVLVKMDAGCEAPAHIHQGVEESFLVSGDVEMFGQKFRAGDYVRAEAGTSHDVARTRGGCVMLMTMSYG